MNTVSRLIETFIPTHYNLSLTLMREQRKFEGTVTIIGNTSAIDGVIKLHSKDLEILNATIDGKKAKVSPGENDEVTYAVDGMPKGEHTIAISFSGTITDHMHGLYPCYFEHEGVKKELLATQFESHHAREVFPCVDEPSAKATFDLSLTTETGVSVLSNMPVKKQTSEARSLVTIFDTTPRMSTYLLAFVVGELQKKTAKTAGGVEVNVYATHAQPSESMDFALETSVRLIEFYDDYFGVPYPLPKSDQVALPDFSSGAMENWGLITYREVCLLAHPKTTSIASRRFVAEVIAHELSHQWFGNLVTMEWWNDLWLNESFAELMMHLSIEHLEPEWNIWLDFATDVATVALRRDAIDGVQPVQVDVNHPDEISTLFDHAIVYAKGARLMRMIQNYIGEDAFRSGLKQYFTDHAYKNTVGNDLWHALANASGKNVESIMNVWISQSGYPVVTVSHEDGEVTLSQKQFFIGPHQSSDRRWPIPLDTDDNSAPKLLDSPTISYPSSTPLQLNRDGAAHFITQYDELSRQNLILKVKDESLNPEGRIQLLNEAILLARGGVMSSVELLPLVKAYENETLEPVWNIISLTLGELRKFVEDNEDAEKKLRQLSAEIADNEYTRLGWKPKDGESEEDSQLRTTVIALTLYGEVPEAIDTAKSLFESTPLEKLNPDLRPLIISSVVRYGDGNLVDELLAVYRKTSSAELREDISSGITSTRVPEKIAMLLECIKDTKTIRAQDVYRWFVYLIRGRESRGAAWQWIRDNWDWVETTFKGDKGYDDFPRYSAGALSTSRQLEEFKTFFEPLKDIPALTRAITMGISEIEGRVELIERDKSAVQKALLSD